MNGNAQTGVRDIITHCLRRGEGMGWVEWLPLAGIAAEQPEQLVEAYNALDSDKRCDLLMLLRNDHAGPLAELLLVTLGGYAAGIADEQDRDFVLEDVRDANQRIGRRVIAMQEAYFLRLAQLEKMAERLEPGFDMAAEIVSMEGRRTELLRVECERGGEFARIHELEHEIMRLQARKRILDRYDREARVTVRDGLASSLVESECRKSELEQAIARMAAEKEHAEQTLAGLREELMALTQANEQVSSEAELEQTAAALLRNTIDTWRRELEQLRDEHNRLLAAAARQEEVQREARLLVENARTRLGELEISAQQTGHGEVVARVREVYSLLPVDLADQGRR